ncbi:hypothetical protein [Companilactobacillus keshanensis]|uniref:Uncharacterized protein n=1 Tax=Companilactobacillus keshanensis TaxID=2486003 RepID=A0ABW4BUB2_9LACO|nr:hypothetical protein [Companilactobacillus keshanensis]
MEEVKGTSIKSDEVVRELEESVGTFNINSEEVLIELVMSYIFKMNKQVDWQMPLANLRSDLVYYSLQTDDLNRRDVEELLFKINYLLNCR